MYVYNAERECGHLAGQPVEDETGCVHRGACANHRCWDNSWWTQMQIHGTRAEGREAWPDEMRLSW